MLRILDEAYSAVVEEEADLLERLEDLAQRVELSRAAQDQIRVLRGHLGDLFLLVVVGEVNSGKSALINEILGASVCEEGPIPVTDRIWVLRHGTEEAERGIDDWIREKTVGHEMLEHVSIVDTPGTNSIVKEHQGITEGFLPRADLVMFVTSIDRAFCESERQFLSLIRKEWHRRVLFVLTKTDTREPEEVGEVVAYVQKCSKELLGFNPRVFPVSVKEARKKSGGSDGLKELKSFLKETLSEEERVRLKLSGPIDAGLKIASDVMSCLDREDQSLSQEASVLRSVDDELGLKGNILQERQHRFLSSLHDLMAELDARGREFIERNVRLRGMTKIGSKERFRLAFEKEVIGNLEERISEVLRSSAAWLVEELNLTWREACLSLENRLGPLQEDKLSSKDPGSTSESRRVQVLHQIRQGVDETLARLNPSQEADRIVKSVLQGGMSFIGVEASAATVGALLIVLFKTAVVTGVVVGAAVAATGFVVLPALRAKAMRAFSDRVHELTRQLKASFTQEFERELMHNLEQVRESFAPLRQVHEEEAERLRALRAEATAVRGSFLALAVRVGDSESQLY